jgi:hypothetical protein
MSSFLAFSTAKRSYVRKLYPEKKNCEVSVILGEMWTKAPQSERQIFVDEERKLRNVYKADITEWRAKIAKDFSEKRQTREDTAFQMALAHKNDETANESKQAYSNRIVTPRSVYPSGMTSPYHHPEYAHLHPRQGQGYANPNERGHNISTSYHNDNSMGQGEFDIVYNFLVRLGN